MSKKPGELETSALTAWTPAQQAALYQLHISKQAEADEEEEDRKEEEKTRRRLAGLPEVEPEKAKPDRVAAADIVDDLVRVSSRTLSCRALKLRWVSSSVSGVPRSTGSWGSSPRLTGRSRSS